MNGVFLKARQLVQIEKRQKERELESARNVWSNKIRLNLNFVLDGECCKCHTFFYSFNMI